ncbi:MAG: response regulator [Candidatus Tectomicrobia bacterium]|uniref:Response regulator n=1 Tax=Tectimicrobiota bacterium TaxID=2528274 RepID=A0A932FUA0_UNCTE|nr:response regulator [Candidatus Tectomicrobia bacterium]
MAKLLLVDDAQFMRMRCAKILIENGHEVVEAENGLRAVEVYQQAWPDGVLMDITMPHMDGLEALKEIKRLDPGAKVIMLTALGQESVVMDAIKSGAKDFIVKPPDKDRLLASIQKMIG